MNEGFKQIIYQTLGYSVSMIIGLIIIAFMQRGFLFKFLVVKASMGKKILIRIKEVRHWDYAVGNWSEQDLVFGSKKERKRINNILPEHIYRSLGLNWIDLDSKKWAIISTNNTEAVSGFDPEKQEALVTRALYKPPIEDTKDKVILVLIVLGVVIGAIGVYLSYNVLNEVGIIKGIVQTISTKVTEGIVVPTG